MRNAVFITLYAGAPRQPTTSWIGHWKNVCSKCFTFHPKQQCLLNFCFLNTCLSISCQAVLIVCYCKCSLLEKKHSCLAFTSVHFYKEVWKKVECQGLCTTHTHTRHPVYIVWSELWCIGYLLIINLNRQWRTWLICEFLGWKCYHETFISNTENIEYKAILTCITIFLGTE